ncbi:hypothetical protein ACLHDG_11345 [Sulfurovum sp. CS9]|uniref:hypothetical protein n=1 Tax=Sulfurovum sp. CS9 TaxID=3391146 RepID=UPI0039E90148
MLRGFGKNYFSLSAILAYSVAHKLQSQVTSAQTLFRLSQDSETLEEGDPPDELLEESLLQPTKPCHCNCYYKRKTRLALLLNHYIPRCPFYCTYFAFRRTGVHPPHILY